MSRTAEGTARRHQVANNVVIRQLRVDGAPQNDFNVEDHHDTNSTLCGGACPLFSNGLKENLSESLPRSMARRRSRSEWNTVVRGLPSKTLRTRYVAHQPQQNSSHFQLLPEVQRKHHGRISCIPDLSWIFVVPLYMRCIDVIAITRRHVGGMHSVNKNRTKMRIFENSYVEIRQAQAKPLSLLLTYNY